MEDSIKLRVEKNLDLDYSMADGDAQGVQLAIENGADFPIRSGKALGVLLDTPSPDMAFIQNLLDTQLSINIEMATQVCIDRKNFEGLTILLNSKHEYRLNYTVPVCVAVRSNQHWALQLLLEKSAESDASYFHSPALLQTVVLKQPENTSLLLKYGANLNEPEFCHIAWAIDAGSLDAIKFIESQGLNLAEDDHAALEKAIERNQPEIFKYIIHQTGAAGIAQLRFLERENLSTEIRAVLLELALPAQIQNLKNNKPAHSNGAFFVETPTKQSLRI